MAKPPGLRDVAELARVSVSTVSRLLNGSLELPEETTRRIRDAIKTLNYQPNPHARRLSRGRSDIIGLVVPDIANPFFATLVASVEEAAEESHLAVALYATLNRYEREIAYLQMIAHHHVDGLIFVTNHPDDGELARLINQAKNVVVVDEDVPGAIAPKLFGDNEQGGYLAGRHLLQNMHKRVLYVGGPEQMVSTHRRRAGFERAMKECGEAGLELLSFGGGYDRASGRQAARWFLQQGHPATAIFAASDEIAIGVLEVFREQGVSVPEDVSIVGYDDVGPLHLFAPGLTAVRQPVREFGRQALSLLKEIAASTAEDRTEEMLLPVELVVRESVAPPRRY